MTSGGVVPLAVLGNSIWLGTLPQANPKLDSVVPENSASAHLLFAPQHVEGGGFVTILDIMNLEPIPSNLTLTLIGGNYW